ncbi:MULTISPECIES: CbiQ family ECF transporter T component [unclassified Enterococcus]|uniref:CbiQ family ECF transporter T component n=1 Tax=unclassified Enterococcus TaxID=2608891 RepID=UPI001557AF86|nr:MULTISPECIES: CbiQ family ECF transporter T component [unclassified Enterococcus]MBS7578271.1 cobalt ABC transporter permease [Enterococcus sp. MMGLQ5-2]MBS7585451.1 cobalt ABC transporter permease [Enterococcus sp. MMGLQ5-1]NPD13308.1 cobalt ABC transporter permease [Enterococcus sp. MMGLQ5-1]NPD38102.1 cobalt ABC transporter permease [Enterococcus sp. MMGLQ5-2]
MVYKKTAVLWLAILIFIFALELSFTTSFLMNYFVIVIALIYLLLLKKNRAIIIALFIPILPALATYWSILLHGANQDLALLMVLRTFVFAVLGVVFSVGIDLEELLLVLEQKGLPTSFVYGIMVVIHAFPELRAEVVNLYEASILRGKKLHFYSPMLYLKTILSAFSFRTQYTEAIYSRGFVEGQQRTHQYQYIHSKSALIIVIVIFAFANLLSFF